MDAPSPTNADVKVSVSKTARYALLGLAGITIAAGAAWFSITWVPQEVRTYRGYVLDYAKDPSASVFRNDYVNRAGSKTTYCGEINTRNGAGGLTGFRRFTVVSGVLFWSEEGVFDVLDVVNKGGVKTSAFGGLLSASHILRKGADAAHLINASYSDGSPRPLTKYEAEARAERTLFDKQWAENCS